MCAFTEPKGTILIGNIISKIYEKVKYIIMNPRVTENMSMMQSTGQKKRSPVDNIIVACSIMERNRTQNKLTYIYIYIHDFC